ncbi:MAG: hypothetical protein ABFS12_09200, partial [Bacteroidota bacterium]
GYIVDRKYEAIKSKLNWIANNRDILPQIGRNIRLKMENEFSWENLIYQWTDFMQYAIELKSLSESGKII